MKHDLIQCTVRLNLDGNVNMMEVVKCGPDAITPAEAVILMARHNTGDTDEEVCISNACVVGQVERSKQDERQRLALKYGEIVGKVFSRGNHMPATMDDLELPADRIVEAPKPVSNDDPKDAGEDKKPTAAERKKELREKLADLNVDVPKGNLSVGDLEALLEEAEGK